MRPPTLVEHFQPARIGRYPVFAFFMQLDKKLLKSKVPKLSLCIHNYWYRPPREPGSGKSIPAVGAPLHYICMGNPIWHRIISKNWNETSGARGEHAGLNLMQKVIALDDELAIAGKSMAGAI
jgi:hypothetical protein